MPDFPEPDEQDVAETLDETNLTRDGYGIANFDEAPDLLDVTAAAGDADEQEQFITLQAMTDRHSASVAERLSR